MVAWIVDRARALRRRRRHAPDELVVTGRQQVWFWLGVAGFWVASDWPVGTLGAGYLASVHMIQYMLYTLVAAPLLVLATPSWRLDEIVARCRLRPLLRYLARPVPAAVLANVILIGTHAPLTVDLLRASQIGSFLLDVVWLVGGWLLWLPVISPSPEYRIGSPLGKMIYLFFGAQFLAMIPGGFLTFANAPLYSTYELAPRVGLSPLDDQQLAGAIMKVGSLPVIWAVIVVLWVRWATAERNADIASLRRPNSSTVAPSGSASRVRSPVVLSRDHRRIGHGGSTLTKADPSQVTGTRKETRS
ncbi:MAG TPA: cytochrome c oxidase assembly protein [Ilumatobacter sp.]|nr:cytochrome c oxidase assembly protein [Ilumatobacter sp.]